MSNRPTKTTVFFLSTASASRETCWTPRADIYSSPGGWLIKLDLAGVQLSDVTMRTEATRIIVSGCRRDLMVNEAWSHYSMEISYSNFERVIELPCDLNRAGVKAELRDGMLMIYVIPEGEGR